MKERRRLNGAVLTPEQKAAAEARRAQRQTAEYQEGLARDIAGIRQEFPPRSFVDLDLATALAALRIERERQGLALTDLQERTRIDRATISKLERGEMANPTAGTLQTLAAALGKRLAWSLADRDG